MTAVATIRAGRRHRDVTTGPAAPSSRRRFYRFSTTMNANDHYSLVYTHEHHTFDMVALERPMKILCGYMQPFWGSDRRQFL